MPCSVNINRLQVTHTHSMSSFDLELQHDQASAVLPIIQWKHSNIALTFLISFIYNLNLYGQALLYTNIRTKTRVF
jgi:hypothetical protein